MMSRVHPAPKAPSREEELCPGVRSVTLGDAEEAACGHAAPRACQA